MSAMEQIQFTSPYMTMDIIESALIRNYAEMADLIEISGKYDLDFENEMAFHKKIKQIQHNIKRIETFSFNFWKEYETRKAQQNS